MSTAQSNCTVGHAIVGDGSLEQQELEDAIENKTDGDFDRSHVKDGSTIPGIGTTAPDTPPPLQTGELWLDPTDPLDTGTTKTHVLNSYNGSAFRPGVVCWHISATAPTFTAGRGMAWWDSGLKIKRLYSTVNGLAGWHPVDRGLALMTNNNGSTCPAGGVVVSDNQTAAPNAGFGGTFTLTTTKKDMSVTGVALEEIEAAATGVVALIGSGMEVEVLCDNASDDATVAAGDYLVTFSTVGEARGVGPQIADPNISTAGIAEGTPMGAFAVALEPKSAGHLARSRLLGFVGQGQWRYIVPEITAEAADFTADQWTEIDMISHEGGGGGGSILTDADHAPIMAVGLDFDLGHTANNNATEILVEVGPNRTDLRELYLVGPTASGPRNRAVTSIVVPTKSNNADSFASAGNVIQVRTTETNETLDICNVVAHKYLF